MINKDVIIIGGGAAGFFAAINIAINNSKLKILILERGNEGLQKVKISGGGRCNVTHAEFIPSDLCSNYPRGNKELLGPFHNFMTTDTIKWFEERGVEMKTEKDGRIFPVSNNSQTIIDCFLNEVHTKKIEVLYNHSVKSFKKNGESWILHTQEKTFSSSKVLISTGSNRNMWNMLKELNHTIVEPVPSLFSFNIDDKRISSIPGITINDVEIKVLNSKISSQGPLLITHKGLSAPSILKLSAFGALEFASLGYKFSISVNFLKISVLECLEKLKTFKNNLSKKRVSKLSPFGIPIRLWKELAAYSKIKEEKTWAELNNKDLQSLAKQLTSSIFKVTGKSTFKEEFVTAGGIDLKEINFKTFESKLHDNLFFAGEILNIDAVTGGFNFQNAWTGAYIAAKSIS
jgi:predicted Rossmann fold flavoprotein